MKRSLLLLVILLTLVPKLRAQLDSLPALKKYIIETDIATKKLVTQAGLNTFFAKKSITYLTGTSDLSLSRFYTTYSGENNRLNLGINIPIRQKNALLFVINPIFQSDLKNGFSTFYTDNKKKDWAPSNNMRGGLKISFLPRWGKIWFYKDSPETNGKKIKTDLGRKQDLTIVRARTYEEILKARKKMKDEIDTKIPRLTNDSSGKADKDSLVFSKQAKDRLDNKLAKYDKTIYEALGKAEADYMESDLPYTRARTFWFSVWGFTPFTKSEVYISPTASQSFLKTPYSLWDVNLQATMLYDWAKVGTVIINPWFTIMNNNSANASGMMEAAEYVKYNSLPGISPQDLAILEKGNAFYGDYKKFTTTNLNLQLVYFFPVREWPIQPGLSFRYEKYWGEYNPSNFRLGIPLSISGKGTQTYNIEVQYRWNDMDNYNGEADHKTTRIIGLSVGLPLAKLY